MASTKSNTAIWSGQTLTAGGATTNSSVVDLTDGFGAALHIKLTNGGSGPTVAAQVQIQTSADNTEWYNFGGAFVGSTTNSAKVSWGGVDIPIGVEYLRLRAGSNTGQNVTVDADISEVIALA
jgi:hypothetical protein